MDRACDKSKDINCENDNFKKRMVKPKQYFDSGEYNMNKAKGINFSNKAALEPAYAANNISSVLPAVENTSKYTAKFQPGNLLSDADDHSSSNSTDSSDSEEEADNE